MKNCDFKQWAKAAVIRAVKTMAQSALAVLSTTAIITEVNWAVVVGSALFGGVYSILTSIAGLPEVPEQEV